MGNLNCATICKSNHEENNELLTESNYIYNAFETNDINSDNYNNCILVSTISSTRFSLTKINSLDLSRSIFDKINDIRFRPDEYVNDASTWNCSHLIEDIVMKVNKGEQRLELFLWSDKKYKLLINRDINLICKDKYMHEEFEVSVNYVDEGNVKIDDIVWKMAAKIYEDEKENIFDVKYKRCIVNAENDDKNKCINIKIVFLYKD